MSGEERIKYVEFQCARSAVRKGAEPQGWLQAFPIDYMCTLVQSKRACKWGICLEYIYMRVPVVVSVIVWSAVQAAQSPDIV